MDIQAMITRYQRIALSNDKQLFKGNTPVDRWLNIMRQHSTHSNLGAASRTFKYIRLFDKAVKNNSKTGTRTVNISECYEMLEKLSKGEAPKELSNVSKQLVFDTLREIAMDVKSGRNTENTKIALKNLQLKTIKVKTYGKRKHVEEVEGIHIVNPLKLPDNLLNK